MVLSLETPGQRPGFIIKLSGLSSRPREPSSHPGAPGYPSECHQPIHNWPCPTAGLPPSRPGPLVKKPPSVDPPQNFSRSTGRCSKSNYIAPLNPMSSRRQIKIPIKGDNKKTTTQSIKKKTRAQSAGRRESRQPQQDDLAGSHQAGPALLSGPAAAFFRGILPAKVWKSLSHIHMVDRLQGLVPPENIPFPDSRRRRVLERRQRRSRRRDRARYTQQLLTHTHAHRLSSSQKLLPLCLPHFASPSSQRCPFATSREGRRGNAGGVGRGETKE